MNIEWGSIVDKVVVTLVVNVLKATAFRAWQASARALAAWMIERVIEREPKGAGRDERAAEWRAEVAAITPTRGLQLAFSLWRTMVVSEDRIALTFGDADEDGRIIVEADVSLRLWRPRTTLQALLFLWELDNNSINRVEGVGRFTQMAISLGRARKTGCWLAERIRGLSHQPPSLRRHVARELGAIMKKTRERRSKDSK